MKHDRSARRWFGLGVAIVVITLLWARSARANDFDPDDAPRTIAHFQFVPSALVANGFIEDTLSTTSSAGLVHFDVTPDTTGVARAIIVPDVRVAALGQTVQGGVKLAPWFGVTAGLSGMGIIPRNGFSALTVGGYEDLGANVGVAVRLLRTDFFQLTARADGSWDYTRSILPTLLPSSPLVTGNVKSVRPSLVAIAALSPNFGIQASGTYGWRWFDQEINQEVQTISGAIALSISANPQVPLTVQVGGGVDHRFSGVNDTIPTLTILGSSATPWSGEAGVFYTGRRDLDLGITVTYQFNSDHRAVSFARFGYYF